jgi:hypothetical protein
VVIEVIVVVGDVRGVAVKVIDVRTCSLLINYNLLPLSRDIR